MCEDVQVTRRMYVAREVAELLRVTEDVVYRLAREGDLPVVRIGRRRLRFPADQIDRIVQDGAKTA